MTPRTTPRVVCDRYELVDRIGRGGMGTVWRAMDTRLQREVALKEVELPRELGADDRGVVQARVLREARVAAKLTHPSAVTVFDVQEDGGRAYIVMELVDAPTLDHVVRTEGPLHHKEAALIAVAVLDALEEAHRAGIVHRDVKPANIMLPKEGAAMLADFGIASLKDDPKLTATGLVLGSPSFMSPEQAEGTSPGAAADLWALGATLFFAVEGRAPFERGQAIATLAAVTRDEIPPMENAGPLEPVIRGLLEKDPERRLSAAQTRVMLRRILVDPDAAAVATPVQRTRPQAQPEPEPRLERAPRSGRAWPWVLATLLALAAVAAATLLLTGGDDGTERRGPGSGRRGAAADSNPSSGTETSSGADTAPGDGTASDAVPPGWTVYRSESTGFEVAHPAEWEIVENSVDDSSIDFRDPASSTFVRIDWKSPPGPSAVGAWEDFEPSFAAEHAGYERVGEIEATTFKGFEAATWEFTFEDGGATIHALDLGFIVRDDYGFAMYFSALDDEWQDYQDEFATFRDTYRPPS